MAENKWVAGPSCSLHSKWELQLITPFETSLGVAHLVQLFFVPLGQPNRFPKLDTSLSLPATHTLPQTAPQEMVLGKWNSFLRPGLFSVAFAPSSRVGKHNQVTLRIFHGIFTFTLPETNTSPLNIALFVSGGVMFVESPQKACLVALPKSLMSKAIFQVPRLLSSYKPWKAAAAW